MTDDTSQDRRATAVRQSAVERREAQDRQDPSGHGMQVTPRQQQHVAESSDDSPAVAATEFDDEALHVLKGEETS